MKKLVLLFIFPLLLSSQELESNLPIIILDTKGLDILDDPRIISDMGIIYNNNGINKSTDPYNNYKGKISIELRGSSSQKVFPKKSYSIETQNLDGSNNNVSLLDLPSENDWVLYAAYSDKTLIRNALTYQLSREMGHYAPRTKFCELILNNEYKGVYMLTEKVKRDDNRVAINECKDDDITGGYILKIDKLTDAPADASWCSNFLTFNNDAVCFQYHYPKADDITFDQKNYIENFINDIEFLISDMSDNQTNINSIDKIDFLSFIDYLIISELSKNVDAYRVSVFLHKDSDQNTGKIHMGPVWDYNLSFGNVDFCQSSNIPGWVLEEETACRTSIPSFWYDLLQNDSFREMLRTRWFELRQSTLSFDNIFNSIDAMEEHLNDAQNRNFELWDILEEWIWPNYQLGLTYQDEVSFLKYWIYNRIQWIDDNLQNIGLIFPDCNSESKQLIQITNQIGQTKHPKKGDMLFYIYDNGCVEKIMLTY